MVSYPELFISSVKELFNDEFDSFLSALETESPTSIRLNSRKKTSLDVECKNPVIWASNAYYLQKRPAFTFDPLFHAGCYYVQEASSMFLEQFIRSYINDPVKCLDLCAAPGGKSTQLSALLPEGSLLVSNEVIRSRSYILSENLIKWGNPACIATNNDPQKIGKTLPDFFDLIVVDAPCSGEGMFRKDKNAISEWSPGNVTLCAERQKRILADIWSALKPGGILIYSTCTYNLSENEENIHWLSETFGATPLDVPVPEDWRIIRAKKYDHPVFRFSPHKTQGEGFFIATVRKPGIYQERNNKNKQERNKPLHSPVFNHLKSWLKTPESFFWEEEKGLVLAIPDVHKQDYLQIKKNLQIVHAGVGIAEIKGKDVIPNHALAVSSEFNKEAFPVLEIDKDTAISYLRKETISLPENTPRGHVLLLFKNYPIGFVKNIGNRSNNLYPQ